MNILILTQYFWPEGFVINDIVRTLVKQGHTIEVITGKPNYPDGYIYDGYAKNGYQQETFYKQVIVHRVPLRPRGDGGTKSLTLNYFSFVVNGILYLRKIKFTTTPDIVLVYAVSPITSAIPGIYLKWKYKLHLAVWVQDLWPESLSATGFIKNNYLLKLTGLLVKFIYKYTDTVLAQSYAFKEPISRYAKANKIFYYPNSFLDTKLTKKVVKEEQSKHLLLMKDKFNIVFAGNLGKAQSLETIVDAAELVKDLPNCQFVVIGSGSMAEWFEKKILDKKLTNVIFVGRHPSSMMVHFFELAACLLVTLKKDKIFSYTIPSKVQAYMAAGRPVIAALDGEGARIIKESGAGLTGPAENSKQLAENIQNLYFMNKSEQDALGFSGRRYYLENYEMTKQCKNLVNILSNRLSATNKIPTS